MASSILERGQLKPQSCQFRHGHGPKPESSSNLIREWVATRYMHLRNLCLRGCGQAPSMDDAASNRVGLPRRKKGTLSCGLWHGTDYTIADASFSRVGQRDCVSLYRRDTKVIGACGYCSSSLVFKPCTPYEDVLSPRGMQVEDSSPSMIRSIRMQHHQVCFILR